MIFGHPKWPPKKTNKILHRSEMARIAIESEVAYRCEMRSKVIFGHPKWPLAAILSKIKNKKCVNQSEFRTSKMADGSHFVKN